MTKKELLAELEAELAGDSSLPFKESNLVFGEGNINAKVMCIGEAPGLNEDKERRPFVGRSGKLLNALIGEIGWRREDVYITNIVKRRPPENRDPLSGEIAAYTPYLARQIEIINPLIIVTLGRFAMNYFAPALKITRDEGMVLPLGMRFLVPMFHPAAALRSSARAKSLRASFLKLPIIVKECESLIQKE